MEVGLLFEECEPVEAGEEDDGEESVGQGPTGPDHQVGQGPGVHRQLSGPPGPRPGLHGGPDDGEGGEDAHSDLKVFLSFASLHVVGDFEREWEKFLGAVRSGH